MPTNSPFRTADDTDRLSGRAFELAASVDRALERHLEECTNRYMNVQEKLEDINKLFMRVAGAIILLLLSIMGWLITHSGGALL